jgi:nitrate/TMAO reductase-like tetraheme cytochrome c subunit
VVSLVGAEIYTARPQFCGTCHIMGSYYGSWSRDVHGVKTSARCVDCHYAPGEQHTVKAKFKGLSQMASYFSGRYGASRPRAHVSDASCLTAPCHGDRAYLQKSLLIGEPRREKRLVGGQETEVQRNPSVQFVHEKHLDIDGRLAENLAALDAVQKRLQQASPADVWPRIAKAVLAVSPAAQLESDLGDLLHGLGLGTLLPDTLELARLEHLRTRLLQLADLNCAACHSYDASGRRHLMTGDLQTCFTCHFTHQAFNRDTGECLKCHEPPTRQILVHDQVVDLTFQQPGTTTTAVGRPVLMDHRDIVDRKIDCASCHFDVIQGDTTVTARDCQRCHDQEEYLREFADRTTETVEKYHLAHVAAQRAHCADCHRVVEHKLIDPLHVATSPEFLEPVLNDCQHCHPGHHHEQVELLMGLGGIGLARPMPNAMFGSRINCRACHTKEAVDLKGDALIKATEATCIACHGEDYARLFQQWRNEIDTYLKEAEASLGRVEARMKELQDRGTSIPAGVLPILDEARANLKYVRSANGIHNKNFALELLDVSIRSLDQAMAPMIPQ